MVEMKERQPFSTISSRSSGKEGPRMYGRVRQPAWLMRRASPTFATPKKAIPSASSARQTCSRPWP